MVETLANKLASAYTLPEMLNHAIPLARSLTSLGVELNQKVNELETTMIATTEAQQSESDRMKASLVGCKALTAKNKEMIDRLIVWQNLLTEHALGVSLKNINKLYTKGQTNYV